MAINSQLLSKKVQTFINDHLKEDPAQLILKGSPFSELSIQAIVQQIQAKRKAEKKLPTWFKSDAVIYPPQLNLAQASSEETAAYKASLVSSDTLIDITGGFGIDDFYFAQNLNQVVHCELNAELSAIAQHNFSVLSNTQNCQFISSDSIAYLQQLQKPVDWIYADPARRSAAGKKIFRLADCQPDILTHRDLMLEKADKILLKTSPLLDLKQGIEQLKTVEAIHIVAVKNEVKELLWIIGQTPIDHPNIHCINFDQPAQKFTATLEDESKSQASYSIPQAYLYEPNSTLLKAGFFQYISMFFSIDKLAPNSHLYTADKLIDFPGRRFKINQILPAHKKELKKAGITKANITTRNFPVSPQQLHSKFKIKPGGDIYLFFTENQAKKKLVLVTNRI